MARVFISYKRINKDKVYKIKDQIESAVGEKCWIDLDGIESDAQFKNVIIKAINECEVVLFMYSKAHTLITDYERDWTIRELNFAAKKHKRIVFINLDGSPLTDAFEFDYGTKQQVNGNSVQSMERLCIDLRGWLGRENDVAPSVKLEYKSPMTKSSFLGDRRMWIAGILLSLIVVFLCFRNFGKTLSDEQVVEDSIQNVTPTPVDEIEPPKDLAQSRIDVKKKVEKAQDTKIVQLQGNATEQRESMSEPQEHTETAQAENIQEEAKFPGGTEALRAFIKKNLKYPTIAVEQGIEGRVVVQFTVKTDGSIDNITILKGVDMILDVEAIRVVKCLPHFVPATKNGKLVDSNLTLPIIFTIGQ